MNKEFLPYELAVKLKELGFDEPCFSCYDKSGNLVRAIWQEIECSAPTFSQAFRFFREKYDKSHCIAKDWEDGTYLGYYAIIEETDGFQEFGTHIIYEEAELFCLEKLIEIVEQSKN